MTFQPWNVGEIVNNTGNIYPNTTSTTALGNGGYVVTWRDDAKIMLQVYDGDGQKVGSAQSVHLEGNDPQIQADVQAIGPDGGFVVTWTTQPSGSNTDVFARKFSATGTAGDIYSLTLNTTSSKEGSVAMSAGPDGGWASVHTNATRGVTLVRYDVNGTKIGEVNVAPSNSGVASEPDVTWLGGDRYVVSYVSNSDNKIHFKLVDGDVVSTDAQEGTSSAGGFSEVVGLKDASGNLNGSFVVVSDRNDFIIARVYTSSGTASTFARDITIKSEGQSTDDAKVAGVAALKDGAFAVAYVAMNGTDKGDIFVSVIDKNGIRTTSPALNVGPLTDDRNGSGTGDQYNPVITELVDGRLAITWEDRTFSKVHVMTRIFDPRPKAVTVEGSTVNDIYHGSEYSSDVLKGYQGHDTLYGGNGNDQLHGGIGDDSLVGGNDNDVLFGGLGHDTFEGGNGKDTVTYVEAAAWKIDNNGKTFGVEVYLHKADGSANVGEAQLDIYKGIEVIDGSRHADIIEGDGASNEFWADTGDDLLKGFGGNDTLKGSLGADTFHGGAGADRMEGDELGLDGKYIDEDKFDVLTYQESTDAVTVDLEARKGTRGEALNDSFVGMDELYGSSKSDILYGRNTDGDSGESMNDTIWGGFGNDLIVGHAGNDQLDGGQDNDTLEGGMGEDRLQGFSGFNFASYANAGAGVRANLSGNGENTGEAAGDSYGLYEEKISIQGLIGSKYNDTLIGTEGVDNELRGGDGVDELQGLTGNDTLDGGGGSDRLLGDAGFDYASYASATAGVTIALPTGGNGTVAGDTFSSIEGLIGSSRNDTLIGNEAANALRGEGGDDVLNGGLGNDTLEGGTGSDVYYVSGRDRIVEHAGQGTDTVIITSDFVLTDKDFANIERIVLDVSTINNTLSGNDDANELAGNGVANILNGLGGNDALSGLGGNDALYGGAGDDVLNGGTGIDRMEGGIGNDTYYVDDLGDQVVEVAGGGIDTAYASVNFNMGAGTELEYLYATGGANVELTGSNFANVITGNAGANKIYGGAGNDQLRGGAGNDKVYGGLGNDMLYGQTGKDTFVFDTRLNKSTNVDRIYDFASRDDTFQLDNKYFTKLGSGTASKPTKFKSDMFVEAKKAQDREDRIVYDKKTGNLYYDQDGTGSKAQVKIATLTNKAKLYYHDFFVI